VNLSLARFQSEFATALAGGAGFAPAGQVGFRVYRNGVLSACVEALRANFPAVERLTGKDWFVDVARRYTHEHPPGETSLLRYGARLPDFLAGLESASALPYLPGVAALELLWIEAHAAEDEPTLSGQHLAGVTADQLGAMALRPHAATRWAWFEAGPVYSIWDANRRQVSMSQPLEWIAQGALLTRLAGAVSWLPLELADCRFLAACRSGQAMAEAAREYVATADIAARFARLLAAGAFTTLPHLDDGDTHARAPE
jgi:hypothetical protein